jgi:hypothetical protein
VENPARAAPNSVRIEPAIATVTAGGSVNVSLTAEAPALGFDSWIIDVSYDGAVADVTGCQPYPPPEGACLVDITAPNTVRAAGQVNEASITGTVSLANITFQALGSEGQCSNLIVNVVSFADAEDIQLNPTPTNGQIVIGAACTASTPTPPPPTATPTPNPDADGDGWTMAQEVQIGTNAGYPCGVDGSGRAGRYRQQAQHRRLRQLHLPLRDLEWDTVLGQPARRPPAMTMARVFNKFGHRCPIQTIR